jgi:hypothetical protein
MYKSVSSAVEPAREHQIGCSEIWGGIQGEDLDVRTSGIVASLHSSAAVGAKGGDIYYISVGSNDLLTRIAIVDVTGHGEDGMTPEEEKRILEEMEERELETHPGG